MKQNEANALALAAWLETRPEVAEVRHPGLPSHPDHALWQRDFSGSSGLFSIVLHPISEAAFAAMVDDLELYGIGASWGGFESLVLNDDPSPVRSATRWAAEGPLLRIHAGLEDIDDLKADLSAGFGAFVGGGGGGMSAREESTALAEVVRFNADGLIPAIAQDADNGQVLMMA